MYVYVHVHVHVHVEVRALVLEGHADGDRVEEAVARPLHLPMESGKTALGTGMGGASLSWLSRLEPFILRLRPAHRCRGR